MTAGAGWQPEPRPEWVEAANRGDVLPMSEVARRPFDRDELLAEACARRGVADTGLGAFGDDRFLEPLQVLLGALEDEAALTVTGRWMTRRFVVRMLEVRLQLVAYEATDPGVQDEVIERPLVVTGAPRTGTTILHSLLATDPRRRAPEGWELVRPVPPPDPDPERFAADARIPLADLELRLPTIMVSGLLAIHEYGARMPKECLSAMSLEFLSEEFTSRYDVPSYATYLAGADMRPAYEMHRRVLRVLQRRFPPGKTWVLKSPVHLHSLGTLLEVYPDARLAITHRDPLSVLGSVVSLLATLRWAHSDRVDLSALGAESAELYLTDLDRLVTLSENGFLDRATVQHCRYADFLADPMGQLEALYEHLGDDLRDDARQRMEEHLAARPRGLHGGHSYSFDDLGLDRERERARSARYRSYFAVPDEP